MTGIGKGFGCRFGASDRPGIGAGVGKPASSAFKGQPTLKRGNKVGSAAQAPPHHEHFCGSHGIVRRKPPTPAEAGDRQPRDIGQWRAATAVAMRRFGGGSRATVCCRSSPARRVYAANELDRAARGKAGWLGGRPQRFDVPPGMAGIGAQQAFSRGGARVSNAPIPDLPALTPGAGRFDPKSVIHRQWSGRVDDSVLIRRFRSVRVSQVSPTCNPRAAFARRWSGRVDDSVLIRRFRSVRVSQL
jgi:hypothetical protein